MNNFKNSRASKKKKNASTSEGLESHTRITGLNIDGDVRIQKFLATQAIGSRRTIEQWIAAGRIRINGVVATLGMKMQSTDRIMLDDQILEFSHAASSNTRSRVLLFNKPEGMICTQRDPQNRPTIFQALPKIAEGRWITVGRLDVNTSGLLLLTTDGDLAHRLMHPSSGIEREYAVRIIGELSMTIKNKMLAGIMLDDGMAKFKSIQSVGGNGFNRWYHVVITEGRKREVRRLFQSQNLTVNRLIRVRFGSVHLPKMLRKGDYVELNLEEVDMLMRSL